MRSSCVAHKKRTLDSWKSGGWSGKSLKWKVHEPIVQSDKPVAQIDPVDKNVSQILKASAPRVLSKCVTRCFFTPRHIFTKCGFLAYLQIDAVVQNVLQILSALLSYRCTLKMCQIPYSVTNHTVQRGLLEEPLSHSQGWHKSQQI